MNAAVFDAFRRLAHTRKTRSVCFTRRVLSDELPGTNARGPVSNRTRQCPVPGPLRKNRSLGCRAIDDASIYWPAGGPLQGLLREEVPQHVGSTFTPRAKAMSLVKVNSLD